MAEHYRDKVAVVTGGASGIGRALCEELCRRGAIVIVADVNVAGAQAVAAALSAGGGRARAAYLDVANIGLVRKVVADTVAEYGRLDFMFNNAAATATRGEVRDLSLEPWHRAVEVNLLGVVYGTTTAYAAMLRQGSGHIVNIASVAGLISFPTSIPYGATKAAVVNLSTSLRVEAADLGVNVSVACPGPVHGDTKSVKLIGVERAAALILRGVERNQAIIVFPRLARVVWWVYRLSPLLLIPLGRRLVRSYRRKRSVPVEAPLRRDEAA
jgi:NAD(P)-dependent dehydrogenase (short-subunit alcohol dehydrogenase family)